jgi:1-aminocyclopropane-1-carboxylate deaminase/D-cysteine desulfhydrase-like pyridoxal-dependent ACC family enzyme
MATALATLMSLPQTTLARHPTIVEPMDRLRSALGPRCPRLLIKRDDLLAFAMGGNKVRKLQAVAAEAAAAGADTLITCGGIQSNHARVTAAAGAVLGWRVILVVNGTPQDTPTGNARLDRLFGADVRYVEARGDRVPAMDRIAGDLRRNGRRPFVIPLGASTPTGALGFARGVGELATAGVKPDVIVHATSSGGTQAGLIAGCALLGLRARVLGISADDPAGAIERTVTTLLQEIAARLGAARTSVGADRAVEIDDGFVGDGYGVPTAASIEAIEIVARTEGILLDPVYTAKAMAGLLSRIRSGAFDPNEIVLFWHTGGVPGLFA